MPYLKCVCQELAGSTVRIFVIPSLELSFHLKDAIMKVLKPLGFLFFLLMAFGAIAQTAEDQKVIKDAEKAKNTLMTAYPGLEKFFDNASGYAIFPNVGKGGFIVGGAAGNGVVYEDGEAIGMADLKKLNVGLQAGGQAVIEVIFFETDDALREFKEEDFQFSAEASAVILESGVAANAEYNDGVVVFAYPKAGLMADASVGGQKFSFTPIEGNGPFFRDLFLIPPEISQTASGTAHIRK